MEQFIGNFVGIFFTMDLFECMIYAVLYSWIGIFIICALIAIITREPGAGILSIPIVSLFVGGFFGLIVAFRFFLEGLNFSVGSFVSFLSSLQGG